MNFAISCRRASQNQPEKARGLFESAVAEEFRRAWLIREAQGIRLRRTSERLSFLLYLFFGQAKKR
jgi:hypothetical protein